MSNEIRMFGVVRTFQRGRRGSATSPFFMSLHVRVGLTVF